MNTTIKKELLNFSIYNFLGITWDECMTCDKYKIISQCAETAYLDMCRTITFEDKKPEDQDKEETSFHQKLNKSKTENKFSSTVIENIITSKVTTLLQSDENNYFDTLISSCEDLVDYINDNPDGIKHWPKDCFSFGQAQKWINMTIKP